MKTPGILSRVSFLVVLHSLFIFAVITVVSLENNQSKIDRLIEYRFDFIGGYFRAELEDIKQRENLQSPETIDDRIMAELFDQSSDIMDGLAGLAVLIHRDNGSSYLRQASAYRPSMQELDPGDYERILTEADLDILAVKGIFLGDQFMSAAGNLKTIYVPWEPGNYDLVLAITYLTEEIVGADSEYNYAILVLFLVSTLITLLIIHLIVRNFIQPLQKLIHGMEKTSEGDVLYRIEDVKNDEIGRVAASFNMMSTALWNKHRQLTESNFHLTKTLSQLAEATSSLAESEAFLSKLIENAPFAIVVTDPDGNILIFSRAAMATFEVRPDEALSSDFTGYFPYAPEKVFPESEHEGDCLEEEMICCKKNGESFPALVCRVPIWKKPSLIHAYLFIVRDISESKGFQEMMISIDRIATRGIMAGEIAHEINNYLAVILGNVELLPLLLSRGDMDKVDKKLEVLKTSVARIQKFSEGLASSCGEEIVFEQGDLNQLVENLAAFLKPQNHYNDINFNLKLSHQLPLVYFDSGRIQQMLINLLNNAGGALREKDDDREITVITDIDRPGETIKLTISDNAGGLPADLEETIFEKRYMGRRRGRGFGLVIVKSIIDKHNGRIEYESIEGQGTTFNIILPIKHEDASAESFSPSVGGQVTA